MVIHLKSESVNIHNNLFKWRLMLQHPVLIYASEPQLPFPNYFIVQLSLEQAGHGLNCYHKLFCCSLCLLRSKHLGLKLERSKVNQGKQNPLGIFAQNIQQSILNFSPSQLKMINRLENHQHCYLGKKMSIIIS